MPEPDKNPWKIEGVKAIMSIAAAIVLGITTGAWFMYRQVNKVTDQNESLKQKVETLTQEVETLKADHASIKRNEWQDLLQRVAKLEGSQGRSAAPPSPSVTPAPSGTVTPVHPPVTVLPPNPAPDGGSPPANPPVTVPSPAKASAVVEGVTAEVVRTKKTSNGVVFQVRITSPDRKSMVFFQRYKDMASRAALNERGPQPVTFSDSEDAPESRRKTLLNVAVNPGSPMIFYAFVPGDSGSGPGSCRELQLVARLNDGTALNFVLTSFPLD